MYESLIVRHCSPTLAAIKTGNLFSCSFECMKDLENQIENLNLVLNLKGVYVRMLRNTYNKALIYVYRPNRLINDLSDKDARKFLHKFGYTTFNTDNLLDKLSDRLCESDEFPHEIGLFLGYPPHDVKGFIDNNGKNYKCVGHWKVYSDESKAKKIFEKYKRCTNNYCKRLSNGLSIQQLTVAV